MSAYTREEIKSYKDLNEKKIRSAASRGDAVVDAMPLKVTMELTADCDLYCKMCEFVVPRERGRKKGYALHMGLPEFEMLAAQALPAARFINLTVVGEPLLLPYLDRVLELCRDWGTRIEFITHGMHLGQQMIEKVGPLAQAMIISFDGGTKATFNRIRVGADFEQVTRNMLRFERWRQGLPKGVFRPPLLMAVTLMRENILELPTLVRIASLLKVDKVSAGWMIAFSEKMARSSCFRHKALANACLRRARKLAAELEVALEVPAEFPGVAEEEIAAAIVQEPELPGGPLSHLRAYLAGAPLEEEGEPGVALNQETIQERMQHLQEWMPATESLNHPTPSMGEALAPVEEPAAPPPAAGSSAELFVPAEPPKQARYTCRFLWNELFVALNGDVAPCCVQGRPVVGNVFKENLDQIWNGAAMQEMRSRLFSGNPVPCCKDCNYNTMLGQGDYKEETFFVPLDREV